MDTSGFKTAYEIIYIHYSSNGRGYASSTLNGISMFLFMEGFSSQREMILAAKRARENIKIAACHSEGRPEILYCADYHWVEPEDIAGKITLIEEIASKYPLRAVHASKHGDKICAHRRRIEALGVRVIAGSLDPEYFQIASSKLQFADYMQSKGLPVVSSRMIHNAQELSEAILDYGGELDLCIKPDNGIYGLGFWRLMKSASPIRSIENPDAREIHPSIYIETLARNKSRVNLVLMPYLPGAERSIDLYFERGTFINLICRRKEGAKQVIEAGGKAAEIAIACAEAMAADGIVNVQTKDDSNGSPVLLEINLRPSGGVCYGSEVADCNLTALMVDGVLGRINQHRVWNQSPRTLGEVRLITQAIPVPTKELDEN